MTTDLAVITERLELPVLPAADIDRAIAFATQDKAPATRAAYRRDFAAFQKWCTSRGVDALPALAALKPLPGISPAKPRRA